MRKLAFAACALAVAALSFGGDSEHLLTIDHYVRVKSTVPAIAGQDVPIYVRERVHAGTALHPEKIHKLVVNGMKEGTLRLGY